MSLDMAGSGPAGSASAAPASGPSAAGTSPGATCASVGDQILELLSTGAPGGDAAKNQIGALMTERRALAVEKAKLSKLLRNETKKRKRILEKTTRLTTMDLVEVLSIRQGKAAKDKSSPG